MDRAVTYVSEGLVIVGLRSSLCGIHKVFNEVSVSQRCTGISRLRRHQTQFPDNSHPLCGKAEY